MNGLIHHGIKICDIGKWWETGGRAQWEGMPCGGLNLKLLSCTGSLSLLPHASCCFPLPYFSTILFLPCKKSKSSMLRLKHFDTELIFPDETRIGLFISDRASKDKPLKSSLVHPWAVGFLTKGREEGYLKHYGQLQNSYIACIVSQCLEDVGLMKPHHGVHFQLTFHFLCTLASPMITCSWEGGRSWSWMESQERFLPPFNWECCELHCHYYRPGYLSVGPLVVMDTKGNLQNGPGMTMSCLEEKAILQHLWNHEPK